jgi:hypothetical protein
MFTRARARVLIAVASVLALFLAVVGCQANQNVDYSQWGNNAHVVQMISACFPQATPTTYAGHDPYASAAVDYMLPNSGYTDFDVTWARFLALCATNLATAGGYNVHYVAFQQRIWTTESQYWRGMEDRGSWTQNHMDHVHVSFFN